MRPGRTKAGQGWTEEGGRGGSHQVYGGQVLTRCPCLAGACPCTPVAILKQLGLGQANGVSLTQRAPSAPFCAPLGAQADTPGLALGLQVPPTPTPPAAGASPLIPHPHPHTHPHPHPPHQLQVPHPSSTHPHPPPTHTPPTHHTSCRCPTPHPRPPLPHALPPPPARRCMSLAARSEMERWSWRQATLEILHHHYPAAAAAAAGMMPALATST